jgi:nicotinate-nucleotide pyrophosphorylase (carboxylating)
MTVTPHIERLVELALEEDLGRGDITTRAVLPEPGRLEGVITAKQEAVVCGLELAAYVFRKVDDGIRFSANVADGDEVNPGDELASVEGPADGLLSAERVALNFLMRLSGIATLTRAYVTAVRNTGARARIVDTRKTTPGWRALEKHAVLTGGGFNHRMDLGSGILIKDNHIAACGSVREAVQRARQTASHTVKVQVEVQTLDELKEALEAGADAALLDNMTPEALSQCVAAAGGRMLLEASGGVNLETAGQVALTGVDLISVGRLTHSAPAVDLSMKLRSSP